MAGPGGARGGSVEKSGRRPASRRAPRVLQCGPPHLRVPVDGQDRQRLRRRGRVLGHRRSDPSDRGGCQLGQGLRRSRRVFGHQLPGDGAGGRCQLGQGLRRSRQVLGDGPNLVGGARSGHRREHRWRRGRVRRCHDPHPEVRIGREAGQGRARRSWVACDLGPHVGKRVAGKNVEDLRRGGRIGPAQAPINEPGQRIRVCRCRCRCRCPRRGRPRRGHRLGVGGPARRPRNPDPTPTRCPVRGRLPAQHAHSCRRCRRTLSRREGRRGRRPAP